MARNPFTEDVEFKTERMCSLIRNKLERNETDNARKIAEELFHFLLKDVLLKQAQRLRSYESFLNNLIFFFIGIIMASAVCMVMDVKPFIFLCVKIAALKAIVAALIINALLSNRLLRKIKTVADTYDRHEQSFFSCVMNGAPHNSLHKKVSSILTLQ